MASDLPAPTPKDLQGWELYTRACQARDTHEAAGLLRHARQLFAEEPEYAPGLAATGLNLGQGALVRGEPAEALPLLQDSVRFWAHQPPAAPGALSYATLAVAHRRLGQLEPALQNFRRSLDLYRALGDQTAVVDQLLDVGLALHELRQSNEALEVLDEAVGLAEKLKDGQRLSRALERRGYVRFTAMSDFSGARDDWTRITEIGDPASQAMAWLQISGIDVSQNRTAPGIAAVRRALEIYQDLGDPRGTALCRMRMADLLSRSEPQQAEKLYGESATTWMELAEKAMQLQCLSQVAALKWQQSHLEEALVLYEKTLQQAEEVGRAVEASACCGALATIHGMLRHEREAEQYAHRAAQHRASLQDAMAAAQLCIDQARAAAATGHAEAAAAQVEAQLATFRGLPRPDPLVLAMLHRAAAEIALQCDRPGPAIEHDTAAVGIYESHEMADMTIDSRLHLAESYNAASEATQRAAVGVAVERQLADSERTARTALARSLYARGSYEEAQTELRRALPPSGETHPLVEYGIRIGLSLVAERMDDAEQAFAELQHAAALVDAFRLDFAMPELPAGFTGELSHIYDQLVRAALRNQAPDKAFEYMELSRSRAMLRLIGFSRLPQPPGVAVELAAQEGQALAGAAVAMGRLQANPQDPEALAQLRERRQELEVIWQQIGDGEYVALRRGDIPSYQAIHRTLAGESRRVVLVEYLCRQRSVLVFGVRPEADQPEVLDLRLNQRDLWRFVRSNFGQHDNVRRLASGPLLRLWQAYDFLVAPIARWAEPDDIVCLVPHGPLHYLPLHTLSVDGQPLVQRNPVVYTPSASLLQYARAKRERAASSVRAAVFGDSRQDLSHSRKEAEAVGRIFGVKPQLGANVTKAGFRDGVQAADIVHFAGHGYFNAQSPLDGGLLLSNGEELTAREVFGLPQLQAQLVTLSGCETGVSDVRPGDELLGLTRAFLTAGARSLLVTLWHVADESSAFLMNRFYSYVSGTKPLPKAEALRRAMQETENQPGWDSFYNWAPYILIADWR